MENQLKYHLRIVVVFKAFDDFAFLSNRVV